MSMQKFKVRGQMSRLQRSKPKLVFSGPQLQFDFRYGDEMMHKAWHCLGAVPYWFSRSSVKFQGHLAKKNRRFLPKLGVSRLYLKFEFRDGCEMMHKDWSSIEEVPYCFSRLSVKFQGHRATKNTVKCHYNACHYNANASLTRSILGSQTAPTCPHDHPRVAQHMGYRCEIIAVWSATAAMTPLCSHTNGIKQRYPTCWLCQYSRFMIDLRSNTLIIHLRCPENAINRPIWLPDARMLKTISVAIKLT